MTGTSVAKVTRRGPDGFWLALGDEELFLPYVEFPWFRGASEADVARVERPSPGHLYWPALDIDLAVESIRDPGRFPLVSRG